MSTEVFRPANGADLVTRSGLGEGYAEPVDSFKKSTSNLSRPSTQGGYRFGQLSQNSFFTRHNPHPARVRHLKGLLDVPICAVNDDGYFSNPRYSLQFPPNSFNQKKLQRIPVNAINVNSQLHPINTVTGLQYFTGLTNYPFREKAVPKVGLVPVTEAWRDELRFLTDALQEVQAEKPPKENKLPERPKTQYSETTGRLIPPPSRAMSRGPSRQGSRLGSRSGQRDLYQRNFQHIAEDPDMESQVLMMLCQILQTEDINAVKAWLCSAGEREKTMVLEMIKTAVGSKEEYFERQFKPEYIENDNVPKLPPINEDGKPKNVTRLTVEEDGSEHIESWKQPAVATWSQQQSTQPQAQPEPDMIRPPTSDAFRKTSGRLRSQQTGRVPTPKAAPVPEQAVLRLTTSAQGNRPQITEPVAPATVDQIQETSQNTF